MNCKTLPKSWKDEMRMMQRFGDRNENEERLENKSTGRIRRGKVKWGEVRWEFGECYEKEEKCGNELTAKTKRDEVRMIQIFVE